MNGRIADFGAWPDLCQAAGNAIHGLVGDLLGVSTATVCEDGDKPPAQLLRTVRPRGRGQDSTA